MNEKKVHPTNYRAHSIIPNIQLNLNNKTITRRQSHDTSYSLLYYTYIWKTRTMDLDMARLRLAWFGLAQISSAQFDSAPFCSISHHLLPIVAQICMRFQGSFTLANSSLNHWSLKLINNMPQYPIVHLCLFTIWDEKKERQRKKNTSRNRLNFHQNDIKI